MDVWCARMVRGVVAGATALLAVTGAEAGELVMFHARGCAWCLAWDLEVGSVYDKTQEARVLPLRRIDAERDATGGVQLAKPVDVTPTFVIAACGREVARITGYPGDDHFWGLLGAELARHRAALAATC